MQIPLMRLWILLLKLENSAFFFVVTHFKHNNIKIAFILQPNIKWILFWQPTFHGILSTYTKTSYKAMKSNSIFHSCLNLSLFLSFIFFLICLFLCPLSFHLVFDGAYLINISKNFNWWTLFLAMSCIIVEKSICKTRILKWYIIIQRQRVTTC